LRTLNGVQHQGGLRSAVAVTSVNQLCPKPGAADSGDGRSELRIKILYPCSSHQHVARIALACELLTTNLPTNTEDFLG
jgi:hypothetical protein